MTDYCYFYGDSRIVFIVIAAQICMIVVKDLDFNKLDIKKKMKDKKLN